ncbi:MAG: helix-turn-helix transcriptional regulator [Bacillota bacterium]
MIVKTPPESRLKAAVSVSQMARMVGLSRARFYDLVRSGTFLAPVYSLANRRPMYTAQMQEENLLVRQTGIGVNNQYVLFYERQPAAPSPTPTQRRPIRQERSGLMESLRNLGLGNITPAQVDEALASNYPNGTAGVDEVTVVRTVYRHLRRLGAA